MLSGAEAVPGQGCDQCPSSCQKEGSAPSLGKPSSRPPLLGPRPVSARGRTRISCFRACLNSPPATLLPLSCLSILATCSWMSLRWASWRLPGQPHHSIAHPVPSQAPQPLPCLGYIRFTRTQKTSSALSSPLQPVCWALLLDQRGEHSPFPPRRIRSIITQGTILGWHLTLLLFLLQLIHSYDMLTLLLAQWACLDFNISYFSNYKGLNEQEKHSHWKFSIVVLLRERTPEKNKQKTLRFIKEKNVFYVIYKYIITCKYKDVL